MAIYKTYEEQGGIYHVPHIALSKFCANKIGRTPVLVHAGPCILSTD